MQVTYYRQGKCYHDRLTCIPVNLPVMTRVLFHSFVITPVKVFSCCQLVSFMSKLSCSVTILLSQRFIWSIELLYYHSYDKMVTCQSSSVIVKPTTGGCYQEKLLVAGFLYTCCQVCYTHVSDLSNTEDTVWAVSVCYSPIMSLICHIRQV